MQVLKVTTLNDDGSIAFEGEFGPEEVRFIMEVGTNFLLQQGALPFVEDDDDAEGFVIEGTDTLN